MEREFSAIDAIYQLLDKVDDLGKRIQVIDDNIKILNNKITKLNKNVVQEPVRAMPTASATGQPIIASNVEVEAPSGSREPDKLLLGPIKIYGYIMNKMKQPVENVVINIFDHNNKLVKSNKSSPEGYWESRLPSGKYNIEYIHSKFKPVNKEIEIPKNVKEYEVK